MTKPTPQDPRPWTAPQPIGYRGRDPNHNPQWATDDSAYSTCLVYAAIGLSILGAIVGGAFWILWKFGTLFFG
jgi:hypothetical protein